MRIIAGEFKGRSISAPGGQTTRPTTDRTREALFNVLAHAAWAPDLTGLRVIDAFAGSGALGIEAISRGAEFCLFVETDSAARGTIRSNIEKFGLFGKTRIHRRSATDLGVKPASVGSPFDVVFLDPPYGYSLTPKALQALVEGQWLKPGALAVAETGADEALPSMAQWEALDTREYGPALVTFLRHTP